MNKRQKKKKNKRQEMLTECFGYPLSYKEEKEYIKEHHEYIVSCYFRNKGYDYEAEEYAAIIGVPFQYEPIKYHYPNRTRLKAMEMVSYGRKPGASMRRNLLW